MSKVQVVLINSLFKEKFIDLNTANFEIFFYPFSDYPANFSTETIDSSEKILTI
jgi:hypothetical protein